MEMELRNTDQVLYTNLHEAKHGSIKIKRKTHRFPAAYILYFEECGLYYIGSTNDVYLRFYGHQLELRNGKHHNGKIQSSYSNAINKTIRISFIKTDTRKEAYDIEQELLNRHYSSGLLFNVFINAATNGHGGKWTKEAISKQKEVAKRNVAEGKLKNAWEVNRRKVAIDGVVYSSIKEAAKVLEVTYATLAIRFSNLRKPNSRYHGRYFYI